MDFYQGVVVDYLRADRAIFVNTECCIQINPAPNPDTSGPHWYCDVVACDFRNQTIFLCEISYSETLAALVKRLKEWHANWLDVCSALKRDCHLPGSWPVRTWLFVPCQRTGTLVRRLEEIEEAHAEPRLRPRITPLEMVQPWLYRSWDHQERAEEKPERIPPAMRI